MATPAVARGELPWGGRQLIVGTGMYGRLPVMPEVVQEAARRKVDLVVVPTEEACRLLADCKDQDVRARAARDVLKARGAIPAPQAPNPDVEPATGVRTQHAGVTKRIEQPAPVP